MPGFRPRRPYPSRTWGLRPRPPYGPERALSSNAGRANAGGRHVPSAYRRTASGRNTASSTAHHASDPATGMGDRPGARPPAIGALPNRSRSAVATALIGFHSADRPQPARQTVGRDVRVRQQRQHERRAAQLTGRLLAPGEQPEVDPDPRRREPEEQQQPERARRRSADPSIRQPTASPTSSNGTVPAAVTSRSASGLPQRYGGPAHRQRAETVHHAPVACPGRPGTSRS